MPEPRARRPINRKPVVLNGVGMPHALHLDEWGRLLNLAFGERPYLVGTAAIGKQWRDVDVRMIFDDEQWDRWIGRHEKDKSMIPAWFVLVAAISTWGREFTGLPIDFQFQLRGEIKDEDWKKPRLPLGLGFYGSNVLTADDMPKEREYAVRILEDAGYSVTAPEVASGEGRAVSSDSTLPTEPSPSVSRTTDDTPSGRIGPHSRAHSDHAHQGDIS